MLGIKIVGRLETLDIMFDLTSVSAAKTDDSSDFSAVYEGHGVQDAGRGGGLGGRYKLGRRIEVRLRYVLMSRTDHNE